MAKHIRSVLSFKLYQFNPVCCKVVEFIGTRSDGDADGAAQIHPGAILSIPVEDVLGSGLMMGA